MPIFIFDILLCETCNAPCLIRAIYACKFNTREIVMGVNRKNKGNWKIKYINNKKNIPYLEDRQPPYLLNGS